MATPLNGILELLLRQTIERITDQIDTDLLASIYAAASLSPAEIRASFERDGIPYLDPATGRAPALEEVEEAAARVIRQSGGRAAVIGAAAAVGGAAALPPEVAAGIVHTLRLAQRLAVLFGFDPETDAGRIVMVRALAAAWGVEVPPEVQIGLRLRDLPALIQRQVQWGSVAEPRAGAWLVQKAVGLGRDAVARRIARLVPGLSTALSARAALRRTAEAGQRMAAVYRRASDSLPLVEGDEVLAEEILPAADPSTRAGA